MIRTRRAAKLLAVPALALATFGLAPNPFAAPASAQVDQPAEPESETAYEALHDAMTAAADNEAVFDNSMKAIERAYRQAPEMMALEEQSPGIIAKIVEAMRPSMWDLSNRIQVQYRPTLIAVYKKHLTAKEAGDLATFYRGPLGSRILRQAAAGYSPDATLSDLSEDKPITQDQVDADLEAAMQAVVKGLSSEDMVAMLQAMRETPAILKLRPVFDEIRVIRVQMENEQPTPEEEARITTAINKVLREEL